MSQELPRLTGFLRGNSAGFCNVNQETVRRATVLHLRAKRKKVFHAEKQSAPENVDRLDWNFFSSVMTREDEHKLREKQKLFNQFMRNLCTLIGEVDSDELHSAAYLAYSIICNFNDDDTALRKALARQFGPVPDGLFKSLVEAVRDLSRWRALATLSTQRAGTAMPQGLAETMEYGADICLENVDDSRALFWVEHHGRKKAAFVGAREAAAPTQPPPNTAPVSVPNQKSAPNAPDSSPMAETKSTAAQTKLPSQPPPKSAPAPNKPKEDAIQKSIQAVDDQWLPTQCQKFITTAKNTTFTAQELAATISASLSSNKSDQILQSELFDLLGDSSFEFIQLLLQKRIGILKSLRSQIKKSYQPSSTSSTPHALPSVTITYEENKTVVKKLKEEERKLQKAIEAQTRSSESKNPKPKSSTKKNGPVSEWVPESEIRAVVPPPQVKFQTAEQLLPEGTLVPRVDQRRMVLPTGTVRNNFKTYEEVIVPAVAPTHKKDPLVPVSTMDDWAQLAFEGYTHLNVIQSKVFNAAYSTNENLLVCAPTGAGKTNIALLCILHEIGQHIYGGMLSKDEFKIVYVAPMKALAQEITSNFEKRLSPLGISSRELTGDMQLSKKEIGDTQVIVTTPEKWDVVTRKSTDSALAQSVRLLIIDEVHLLHEDRGPVLEILVARTLRQVESTQSMVRIVGLSATLPNYQDIAQFLRFNLKLITLFN
ncbi:activating signal cointegrator 1 complex subunit 3 [Pelomyxa schiedti]|nr:activating signal cointegrator 1 complex subunit 3 [Pelomyxa schiedti]